MKQNHIHKDFRGFCVSHEAATLPVVRPHLEYYSPQHKKELLKQVQRRAVKMVKGLEHLFYENSLRELGMFNLKNRRVTSALKGGL